MSKSGAAAPGARADRPRIYALTGGTVIAAPGEVLEGATVVLRDGLIEAVGVGVEAPPDADSIDVTGRFVYPALIDAHSELGLGLEGIPTARALLEESRDLTEAMRLALEGTLETGDAKKTRKKARKQLKKSAKRTSKALKKMDQIERKALANEEKAASRYHIHPATRS